MIISRSYGAIAPYSAPSTPPISGCSLTPRSRVTGSTGSWRRRGLRVFEGERAACSQLAQGSVGRLLESCDHCAYAIRACAGFSFDAESCNELAARAPPERAIEA